MRDPDTGICPTCAGRPGLHPARFLPALLQHSSLWGPSPKSLSTTAPAQPSQGRHCPGAALLPSGGTL